MEQENPRDGGRQKPHVVFCPSPITMGHVRPMMDLAIKLVTHHGFSVTVITTKGKTATERYASYLQALSSSTSDDVIRLLELPELIDDSNREEAESYPRHPLLVYLYWVEKSKEALQQLLQDLLRSSTSPICAFLTDFFHMAALDVTTQLSIPTYLFHLSSAANVCLKLYLPKFAEDQPDFVDRPDAVLQIPGLRPLATRDLPSSFLDKSCPTVPNEYVALCSRLRQVTGIFINSFAELEEEAIRALRDPKDEKMPAIYPIGPILCSLLVEEAGKDGTRCLGWLDKQRDSSVLYIAFGSVASMSVKQVREIAWGLEGSGRCFLWVLQGRFLDEEKSRDPEEVFSQFLAEGFQTRIRDRGLVVSSWVPQIRILAHPSIGGFVSHCGWNSLLEGIWNGVPFAAWPLQAEQPMNRLFIVDELEIGLEARMDG
uniref:TSA: Wollemia nobilis Ref_Wollemi_Transcript_13135_1852 transcribed RNA sequence n=1 Tax=Wollemia nobilis TaxID=56998 RepID=A0A0C9RU07_9CONI